MSMEQDPASRDPWPLPTHSIGETPTTGIMPPRITGPVTMPGPEPLEEVITWVPEAEAEKVPGMGRVAIVEWAGRSAKRCVMWDADGWLDAWSLQHVRNRVLFVAEVKGPQ